MNLGNDSESDVETPVSAQTPVTEPVTEPIREQDQHSKSEILNQTRRLRIVKDFLRRTLKLKRI